ncbi:Dihydrodipicolinate synthase [uncultured Ruminococcus sp.]|uniref:4-hydroxy-tetrahydrodipicolinate synthase n=1 Tax=Massiliimalia timonensis TaxID=1987501 RepID=UPI000821E882|nr:4-hydroxy-tetrahydrodipicolinate synthase [Massiliimalia timonensis]SCH02460.1 Dihydrodipicolinate synthase [uncultured Clostridium sp.]SCH98358.1 Dihydrodipicolinate synthase [uncultured Ruminococcus sp.]
MKKRIFTGAGVAIITPMNPDMSVNFDKLKEIIDFQIENGTDAIIICGTTGEGSTLSDAEHREAIKCAIEHTAKRVPVIAGTGSNDTAYAISLSKEAEQLGADGLLLVTPYYNKTSQRGLIEHYKRIAANVSLPIILYSVQSRTGVNIAPETCYELSKIENIVAVKEASGNISQVAKIRELCGDELDVYSGNDDQIVPIMSLGGIGVISVLSNIMPKETHDICQLYLDGKVKESADLQLKLLDVANKLFLDVNPIPVKEAMNLMGMEVGECRLPLIRMDDASVAVLKEALQNVGLVK